MPGRIAVLYDIHGNQPALEAVLDEVRRAAVDAVVVGGDVMPGPFPGACLDLLRSLNVATSFIHGNGESAVLEAQRGGGLEKVPERFRDDIRWCARELSPEARAFISEWPLAIELDTDTLGRVLFCHATPRNDTDVFTKNSPDARVQSMFASVAARVAICGHTHMQFDRTVGGLRIVNAGSVGMPFGAPGAYWILIGDEIQLRFTSYDLESAATRIRASAFPGAERFAATVLGPPSELAMLESYTAADR
jgi:predicted phosphodiesterase